MFTSEIIEKDQVGNPVRVSPRLMACVERANAEFRNRFESETKFHYSARWEFPDPEKTLLQLQVVVPNEPAPFRVEIPHDTLLIRDPEWFVGRAIEKVLKEASRELQKEIDSHLHNLVLSFGD